MKTGSRADFWFGLGLLLATAALIVGADVQLLRNPTFFAEEGVVFFQRAYRRFPVFDSHWADVGYFDLVPVVSTVVAARTVDLESAPLITTLAALLAHLVPAFLVATSTAPIFARRHHRALAILALVISVPIDELWLTTLASKFYLALVPVLLLVEALNRAPNEKPRLWRLLCMAVSPMTGGTAFLLLLLVVLLAWKPGTRPLRRLAMAFLIGAAAQALLAFVATEASPFRLTAADRVRWLDPISLASGFFVDGVLPRLIGVASALSLRLNSTTFFEGLGLPAFSVRILWALVAVAFFAVLARSREAKLLLTAAVVIAFGSMVLGISTNSEGAIPSTAARYFIAPGVLVTWSILAELSAASALWTSWRHWLARAMIFAILITGIAAWFRAEPRGFEVPSWKHEVALWRKNSDHALVIAPPSTWAVWLPSAPNAGPERIVIPVDGADPSLVLDAAEPRIGKPFHFTLRGAPPHSRGIFFCQPGHPVPPRKLHPAPLPVVILPEKIGVGVVQEFRTNANGCWEFELDLNERLVMPGMLLVAQAFLLDPDFAASNGVALRLGQ